LEGFSSVSGGKNDIKGGGTGLLADFFGNSLLLSEYLNCSICA
jgi:hypothetical protein